MNITIDELWNIVVQEALLHDGVVKSDLFNILNTDGYDVKLIEVLKNEKIQPDNRVIIFIDFMYKKDRTLCEKWAKRIVDRVIVRHILTYPNKDVKRWGFWRLFSDIHDTLKSNQNTTNLNAITTILSNEEIKDISKQLKKNYLDYAIESITLYDELLKTKRDISQTLITLTRISDCAALAISDIPDDFLYEILEEEIYKFIRNDDKNYDLCRELRYTAIDDEKLNQLNDAIYILTNTENNKVNETTVTNQSEQ